MLVKLYILKFLSWNAITHSLEDSVWLILLSCFMWSRPILHSSDCFWCYEQINNAGTNKGFRPLLQFTDDEIEQVGEKIIIFFASWQNLHHDIFFICLWLLPKIILLIFEKLLVTLGMNENFHWCGHSRASVRFDGQLTSKLLLFPCAYCDTELWFSSIHFIEEIFYKLLHLHKPFKLHL